MKVRALVVDDEPFARQRLVRMLGELHPHVEVVAEGASGSEAAEAIDDVHPDLVFMDIELPEFDGFEVLRRVEHRPAVIFTTGHDQYAVQAFQAAGIDYLLKPIEPERLQQALDRFDKSRATHDDGFDKRVETLLRSWRIHPGTRDYLERIAVRLGERILLIDVKDVTHFYAKDKYVFLVTVTGKEHIVSQTITELEEQLDPNLFVRVHRSTIVNSKHIKEIQIWFGGKYRLVLADKEGTQVVVSKNMARKLKTVIPF